MREWTKEERYKVLTDPEEIRPLHERIARSPYRQLYHIQPVTGLLNDPNGFVRHDGKWHLFYQWCPWGAVHGLKYWYHIESKDLVTWENRGVCIRPDAWYDNKGAYSGSALPTSDGLYLYYTGNHRDEDWKRTPYTCLVELMDDGRAMKFDRPLFGPENGYTEHQRDPKIIYNEENNRYYIMIGAQNAAKQGRVLVYESDKPLEGWHFKGELKIPGFEDLGDMWECPSVERLNGHDVLIFCPQHVQLSGRGGATNHNGYLIGKLDFEQVTFTPDGSFHVLDFGFDSYAAECAATDMLNKEQAMLVAWMGLPDAAYPTDEEEWQGCLTLPRELTVRNRRLIQRPLPGLTALRGETVDPSLRTLPRACEMELDIRGGDLELDLFTDENGSGGLAIRYDDAAHEIRVDRSGMRRRFNTGEGEERTRPLENGLKHLRIFVDSSSVEIFVNDGDAVFTSRVFPTETEHGFRVRGEAAAKIWTMRAAVRDDFVV